MTDTICHFDVVATDSPHVPAAFMITLHHQYVTHTVTVLLTNT